MENKKEEASPQEQTKKTVTAKIENIPNTTKIVGDKTPGASTDTAREELEQRRTMLQNMKDFDFQIKKNQEDITNIFEKVESLSKDLDDLVSLYEIVSEQMNPFVGLSKVTKKRIDALENFTKEVETVKTRIGELESMLEKNGVNNTASIPQTPVKPPAELNIKPETPAVPRATAVDQPSIPIIMQSPPMEKITDKEMDELLNKSLESLLMEQNIDTMINEFFINLK